MYVCVCVCVGMYICMYVCMHVYKTLRPFRCVTHTRGQRFVLCHSLSAILSLHVCVCVCVLSRIDTHTHTHTHQQNSPLRYVARNRIERRETQLNIFAPAF